MMYVNLRRSLAIAWACVLTSDCFASAEEHDPLEGQAT